ncbi:MAG: polyphosphate kinase 1 [Anaerolineales bacterium]|nr:polyphosphate kinase 1 [Anaerolineales bacterium]MCX7755017.1 polyphosphate kinase 1 [Anaerolineales bacterium]MDW8278738.1 polyphosphate kinase 1 [Anaerolineales bacterium]
MTLPPNDPILTLSDPKLYINRELGMLEFQRRVLEEAQDENNPLLERVKFLAIFGSNMDEFFMVRVSGIRKQVEAHIPDISIDGRTPRDVLAAIRKTSHELYEEALHCWNKKLLPKLDKAGIHILDYTRLNPAQRERADTYFREVVFPVLTPLALDPGHPFPHISNLSLNLAVVIRDTKGNEKFARLKVPDTLPRLVPVKRSSGGERKDGTIPRQHYFVWLEQVIAANLTLLFPGMQVVSAHPFRIVRDADVEIQELEADDLLETMQASIRRRKFGSVVQVAIYESMPSSVRDLLIENLEVRPTDLYIQSSPLGLVSLWQLYNTLELHELKYPPYKPFVIPAFRQPGAPADIFDAIRQENLLLHHPYDSFTPVVDFLNAAARDPQVLAIKQTLYRVGQNSPVVEALLEASERGKQVAVLVELKARFDEESNIGWARRLEQVGVHVVYGLVGLKTHSKIAMVVRREGEGIRRYLHLATGNYNPSTARIYEDLGLFTCDEEMGADATDLFNYLTGYSTKQDYKKLLVAPVNLRRRLEALIRREIAHARAGKKAHLIFKVNAIVDQPIIQLLYEASQSGVQVDLLVRGICCLRPGLKGVSENIRVISIVGRYLEHSRIYYFYNDGAEEIYLGSADLMPRNLDHRVEVVFPLEKPGHVHYMKSQVLDIYLKDTLRARLMRPDGTYVRAKADNNALDVQAWLMSHRVEKKM